MDLLLIALKVWLLSGVVFAFLAMIILFAVAPWSNAFAAFVPRDFRGSLTMTPRDVFVAGARAFFWPFVLFWAILRRIVRLPRRLRMWAVRPL